MCHGSSIEALKVSSTSVSEICFWEKSQLTGLNICAFIVKLNIVNKTAKNLINIVLVAPSYICKI